MKWIYLSAWLLLETLGFVALKYSRNLTVAFPVVLTVAAELVGLGFLILALKKFETSFVYMVAAGAGTALVVVANWLVFKQPLNPVQILSILAIIAGTVGLRSQTAE